MERKIITIGYELPGHSDLFHEYSASQSLLDADIIIFESDFGSYELDYPSHYQGKPIYGKNSSFDLKEDSQRWRRELSTALEAGKTVFVFFQKYEDVFVYTGDIQYSGTGRNARTTNMVTDYNNYQFFPVQLPTIVSKEGQQIIFSDNPIFSSFWNEFKDYLTYKSYLDGSITNPIFLTKTGEKVVGALFRVGPGSLVLLPPLKYDEKTFVKHDAKKKEDTWTKEAIKFGNRLIKIFVEIDETLRKGGDKTPPPDWTDEDAFQLAEEIRLKAEIKEKSEGIDDLVLKKNELITKLDQESRLKDLLFEKGKNLENAIIFALEILGYKAERYNDGELELDQVILSPEEDRFIGEAEGKDSSAINIDKFRQLATNIQEDLHREEVKNSAIGILFGNGFRLTKPSERTEQFTEKCINTAKTLNHILIRTSDLFRVVKYIKESKNESFAKKCRDAIKNGIGKIIEFSSIPAV